MLFSRAWLEQYVTLPATREVAQRLTFAGFSVERVEKHGDDDRFDIDVTANRPDCMCHFGLARELAVLLEQPLRPPEVTLREDPEAAAQAASVEVLNPAGCPRYTARVIRDVRVGPSPAWLRTRLEAIGLRSINNVVDVTNYVLWERGQPLHAYDLALLEGARIVVRPARPAERLTTLDGVARECAGGELIIADAERAIGLAGVMGGENTEVSAATVDVLLESAAFDRRAVRLTTRRFGMHTDASHRFERGTDGEGCADAAGRAAALIAEVAGGRILMGVLDVRTPPAPLPHGRLELARLDRFAGVATASAEVERILTGLGFIAVRQGADVWDVTVPSWRLGDMVTDRAGAVYEADLFEEIVRITGFERIPAALPGIAGSDGPRTVRQVARDRTRSELAASGFAEAVNFSFLAPELDAALPGLRPEAVPLRLTNPLSERYAVMRRSVLAGLVESARTNLRRDAASVRLFEIATVFYPAAPGATLPEEPEHLAIVCGGQVGEPWDRGHELDLFDLKGAVERVGTVLGHALTARSAPVAGLLEGVAAELLDDAGRRVGIWGQLPAEGSTSLFVAELSLSLLVGDRLPPPPIVVLPSRYPGVGADFTLTHSSTVPWADIRAAIAAAAPTELAEVHLNGRYEGEGVPEGAVNTTIAFLYNVRDRSLTQDEVNAHQQALTAELAKRFGWRD